MGLYLNPDNRTFAELVSSDIYVDKTGLIAYMNSRIGKAKRLVASSRPRRFGKTLAVDMLTAYYSKGCDSKELFSVFEISKDASFEKYLKTILDDVVIEDYVEFHLEENCENLFGGYVLTIEKFASDRVQSKIMEFNNKNMFNSKKSFQPIEISEDGLELIEFLSLDCTSADGEWHSDSEVKIDKNGYVILNGKKTKEFWDGTIRSTEKPLRLKIRNICGDETVLNV